MRMLGIDYGMARIGLALSDPTGLLAQPFSVLPRVSDKAAVHAICEVAKEYDVDVMVVGWPRNMNGSVGPRATACEVFAERLRVQSGRKVELYDERLTTVAAEKMLVSADVRRKDRKQVVDAIAAAMMLQGYLDRYRATHGQA
jgi:putative Holliday junction resolvase